MQFSVQYYQVRSSEHAYMAVCDCFWHISVQYFQHLPLQAETHLSGETQVAPSSFPPSVCLRKPNTGATCKHETRSLPLSPLLHNCFSVTLTFTLTLAPLVPALSCAVISATSSELAVIITVSYLLFLRFFTLSPLHFHLTPASIHPRHFTPCIYHDERGTHRALQAPQEQPSRQQGTGRGLAAPAKAQQQGSAVL